jgi:hypothetical protein
VPETLIPALDELTAEYEKAKADPKFAEELDYYFREYVGRATPLYFAEHLTEALGGAKIYLKREDLCHTGAHKLNNVLGQILVAKRMGKPRIIAETGAGQHGVATATACALFGFECEVFMGEEDMERQIVSYRVIADHGRAATFLIGEGVLPGNEWRSYVLRRVMRRAMVHGRRLGLDRPFLGEIARVVTETMGDVYPEIVQRRDFILKAIQNEEAASCDGSGHFADKKS